MASKNPSSQGASVKPNSPKKTTKAQENVETVSKEAETSSAGGTQAREPNKAEKERGKGCSKNNDSKVDKVEVKTRAMLEQQVSLLEKQVKQQEGSLKERENQCERTKVLLAKAQDELKNCADFKEKNAVLSEENGKLRDRLAQKDEEIVRLEGEVKEHAKTSDKNHVQKSLQKENGELHRENEQLKVERNRVRRSLKEKQDQIEKMSASIGDLQQQLFQARRSIDERTRASLLLEDRLGKLDGEMRKYRKRVSITTQDEDANNDVEERSNGGSDDESGGGGSETTASDHAKVSPAESDQERVLSHSEQVPLCGENVAPAESDKELQNKMQISSLKRKEEKLLQDKQQLEKHVTKLNTKIMHLEGQLRNRRSAGKRGLTADRGSQTDIGPGGNRSKVVGNSTSKKQESGNGTIMIRKCKGIIKSLGRFFDELIAQSHDGSPKVSSRARRTAIAARRAHELLRELSVSIDYLVLFVPCETEPSSRHKRSGARHDVRSGGGDIEGTLWDKVSHEVANHEFSFESPTATTTRGDEGAEVKRAGEGLNKLYRNEMLSAGTHGDEGSKTELIVRELLRQHHQEIKHLFEKACMSGFPSFATNMSDFHNYDTTFEHNGADSDNEASLAVQELDNFKTRSAKVQSLVLKMQAFIESSKEERDSLVAQLQALESQLGQKEALLVAKTTELRRRHCKTLEVEKALQARIEALKDDKAHACTEIARLHELCRHKDRELVEKGLEVKSLHDQVTERARSHQENMRKMKKKVEEAWNQYSSVKLRAEKRSAEFSDAAEKLKVSQGYLLDLWQTLKTVDNVVDSGEEV